MNASNWLDESRDILDLDKTRSYQSQNGFCWWANTIRTEVVSFKTAQGSQGCRISSNMWKGYAGDGQENDLINSLMRNATLSAPTRCELEPARIRLVTAFPLDDEKSGWISGFVSLLAAQQNAEASRWSALIQDWKRDVSAPFNTGLCAPSPFEQIEADLLNGIGKRASLYAGELENISEQLYGEGVHNVKTGSSGLCAALRIGDQTGLFRMLVRQPHARLGNGLFVMLTVPVEGDASLALRLNQLELSVESPVLGPGSWCAGEVGLTHISFYPNAFYRPGIESWITDWSIKRAAWVASTLNLGSSNGLFASSGGRNLPLYQALLETYRGEQASP